MVNTCTRFKWVFCKITLLYLQQIQKFPCYGNTPNEALKQYKTALQRGGSSVDGSSKAEEKQINGTVVRVYKEKSGEFTIVSFLLDNRQSFIRFLPKTHH